MTPDERAKALLDEAEHVCLTTDCDDYCRHPCRAIAAAVATALREAEARALERAEDICTQLAREFSVYRDHWPQRDAARECAAAIRAEKERTP